MAVSKNKQVERDMLSIAKKESKKNLWSFRGWQSYKIIDPFILIISFSPFGKLNKLSATLEFKLKDIDHLNRELLEKEDYFKNGPLYYKINSFGMVFPFTYHTFQIDNVTEESISNLFIEIESKVSQILNSLTDYENLYQYLKHQADLYNSHNDNRFLLSLIYINKYQELKDIILRLKNEEKNLIIIERDLRTKNQKSFYDILLDYINNLMKL